MKTTNYPLMNNLSFVYYFIELKVTKHLGELSNFENYRNVQGMCENGSS